MRSMFKASVAALGLTAITAAGAFADGHGLSGDLKITSDMSNPAPRAVMEGLVADFGELHPNLNIELTIVDREAWFVPFIAPKEKSVSWWFISVVLISISLFYGLLYLKGLVQDPEFQKNFAEAIEILKG